MCNVIREKSCTALRSLYAIISTINKDAHHVIIIEIINSYETDVEEISMLNPWTMVWTIFIKRRLSLLLRLSSHFHHCLVFIPAAILQSTTALFKNDLNFYILVVSYEQYNSKIQSVLVLFHSC